MTITAGFLAEAADILKHANSSGYLQLEESTALTIAAGVVTASKNFYRVDTQGGAGTDDLDTITIGSGVADGHILVLRAADTSHTVIIKHNTGNIVCVGEKDIFLVASGDFALLVWDGNLSKWLALGHRDPVVRRQGGHAVTWNTSGTTDYAPQDSMIQVGSVSVTVPASASPGVASVSFPTTFGDKPIVILTPFKGTPLELYAPILVAVTVSSFNLNVWHDALSGGTVDVYWVAIGPRQ